MFKEEDLVYRDPIREVYRDEKKNFIKVKRKKEENYGIRTRTNRKSYLRPQRWR